MMAFALHFNIPSCIGSLSALSSNYIDTFPQRNFQHHPLHQFHSCNFPSLTWPLEKKPLFRHWCKNGASLHSDSTHHQSMDMNKYQFQLFHQLGVGWILMFSIFVQRGEGSPHRTACHWRVLLTAAIVPHCDFWCGICFTSALCRVDFFQYRGKSLGKNLLNFLLWALLWVEFITTKYVDIWQPYENFN